MPSPNDYASVRTVIDSYIKGSYTADTDLLKRCFHPDALMSGYYRGDLDIGSPQPFFDQLESEPSSKSSGEDYQAELSFIHMAGCTVSAGVVKDNLLGTNYVNQFHLLKIDDQWRIISKIYVEVTKVHVVPINLQGACSFLGNPDLGETKTR